MVSLRNKSAKNKSANNVVDVIHEAQPKKIVIVTGPTFGTVMGFLVVGAAIGAAGVLYFKGKGSTPHAEDDAIFDGLSGGGAKDTGALADRANAILRRVKTLASRAKETIQTASEAIAPAVQDAIQEAKSVASQTERDLQKELHEDA